MILIVLLVSLFLNCSLYPAEDNVKYRIIYVIHGDGDYLYHDKSGEAILSDEMILQQAVHNAERGVKSEYFIFHLKPKRTFLIFFPGEESSFYHYRNGELISEKKFFRFDPVDGHSAESFLIKEEVPLVKAEKNIFLFYGHEIPVDEEYGYNYSFPEVPFGLKSFTGRLNELLTTFDVSKFDLLVISTCNNGSPEFITGLSALADYIIASPGDLHLSQMDSKSLLNLERQPGIVINAFALQFAAQAFAELQKNTFTEVVISVYNTQNLVNENYDLSSFCSEETFRDDIVRVFFHPAKFGVYKARDIHSGWYCRDKYLPYGSIK